MNVKNLSQNFRPGRAKFVLIAAALLVCSLAPTGAQAILGIGEPAPAFSLESGNNKKLSLDMLRGKVVVLFYATRDTVEVNDALSRYLDDALRGSTAKYSKSNIQIAGRQCHGGDRGNNLERKIK